MSDCAKSAYRQYKFVVVNSGLFKQGARVCELGGDSDFVIAGSNAGMQYEYEFTWFVDSDGRHGDFCFVARSLIDKTNAI